MAGARFERPRAQVHGLLADARCARGRFSRTLLCLRRPFMRHGGFSRRCVESARTFSGGSGRTSATAVGREWSPLPIGPTASLGYPATASYDTFDGANHPFGCWWCGYHP